MYTAASSEHVYDRDVGHNTVAHHQAREFIKDTSSLISLPEVCLKLRSILDNPSHIQKDVAEVIIHDPALTVRLLRIVNSAYYGLSRPVENINHALGILGEEELNNLIIVTSIINTMSAFSDKSRINLFWRSSIFSAVLANTLAGEVVESREDAKEFFITGLLLNVGKLMLYHTEPGLYDQIASEMAKTGEPDYVIEQKFLGFDHSTVGAVMAESWNFSMEMMENIAGHHSESPEEGHWSQSIMYIAAFYADRLNFTNAKEPGFESVTLDHPELLGKLNIGEEYFEEILQESFASYLQAFELFCGESA